MQSWQEIERHLSTHAYTWLITGVAGFIGSNLLTALLLLDQKVVGIDNFSTGTRLNLKDALSTVPAEKHRHFTFYEGDICHLPDCRLAVTAVDYVLHHAALGSVPRSILSPEMTHAANATGFLNILIAAKEAAVKRFIYASSSSVYGDSPMLPKVETTIGNPLSPYAVSKYVNELYAKAFAHCYGVATIGLRYFNIFGRRQNPNGPYAAVIPLWISALLKSEPVYINGDGETSRDFCYIDNVIRVNLLAALSSNQAALNQVYNVTVGEQTTLNQLLQMIAKHLGKTVTPVYRDFRDGDIRYSLADIARAKNFLGYQPLYTIQEGIVRTVDWYCNHASSVS